MRVVLASAAYLAVVAGGVKVAVDTAHTLATAASPLLILPVTKPNAPPSLVERRLIAQSAPQPVSQPLRRVVAMTAPDMPIAQLAYRLDEAETAYEPPRSSAVSPAGVTEVLDASALPAAVPETMASARPPLLQVAALEITRAEFGQPTVVPKRRPKQAQNTASLKRKGKAFSIAKARAPIRLAMAETPGLLMYRGFVKRQS